MVLKSDSGIPLEVKEPIVYGKDGEEIPVFQNSSESQDSSTFQSTFQSGYSYQGRMKTFKLSGWWIVLAFLALVPILFVGAAFVLFLIAGALVLWAVRRVLRSLF